MLEQQFGWKGILVEPATVWHAQLKHNRQHSIIETLCVWTDSGHKIMFNETEDPYLSTIHAYSNNDHHAKARKKGKLYEVTTIALVDLFKKYNAPECIDYLSIDTEGSDLDILEAYFQDNKYYKIKIITCHHNFTDNQDEIYELLTSHGYIRKWEAISAWDDFYVLEDEARS